MSLASITKESAWAIFEGIALGQRESAKALARLTKPEFEAYECWKEDFELALQTVGVEAQNEAVRVWNDNPVLKAKMETVSPTRWMAEDYINVVSVFKGTKYEQLHLSAMFRFENAKLLLELAKPQS